MAYTPKHGFLLLVAALSIAQLANAGDPDILSDFVLPGNVSTVDGNFFTFTGLRALIGAPDPTKLTVTKVSMAEFPALNGQSVSYAVLQYPAGTVNPPHTHPRSAEFLFLIDGTLEVGIVDTTNKLYTQTLQSGDLFVFPKGLVHYQYNTNSENLEVALSAFGSANAGTVSVPTIVFSTGIDDGILAKSFKTDVATIQKIKAETMAYTTQKHCFLLLVAALSIAQLATAGDPDILSDFVLPGNVSTVDGNFFTFTGLRALVGAPDPTKFTVTKVSMAEFPALNGQSVSYAVLQYPAGTVNPPHTHPRSAEFLFLIDGTLEVGIVDTTNKLYTQTLQSGDLFVFPKGLVHYQYNTDSENSAVALSAFGSANAGTVSVPSSVFTTGIDDDILAKSFKTDVVTIQKIKAAALSIAQLANAGDPDILSDFVLPGNVSTVDGNFFTFTGLRALIVAPDPTKLTVTKVSMAEFPALNGQSVSYAVLQYPAGTVNPPHTHPRSAEFLFLIDGTLEVGIVDTTNKLYTQTLQSGDLFVFPKGLVHYQYNTDSENLAVALSAFGSANAGTVSVPSSVFTTGIDDDILAKSFKTDVATIQKIKAGLAP
ncbi:putative germin-like protein 9-2 [Cinnamomum micranthum f. kanehirae]|uniref:Putative germin-like protein 9-2 n=1 Tax=Cinnamomum micranthum f. kanehirae TaxID=337451 RepID=A0A3S3LYZ6_9MAGN|nr:putative germin-like protein 9-2 [Cinnamomum micranthum f. kanehirae]